MRSLRGSQRVGAIGLRQFSIDVIQGMQMRRDSRRIAAGDPTLWRDVLIANRVQVLDQAARFRAELQAMEDAMSAGDAAGVEALIAPAASGRSRWRFGG